MFPTFSDFLEEVIFHAERMNIPQFKPSQILNSKEQALGASSQLQHKRDLGARALASRTTASAETSGKNQEEIRGIPFDQKITEKGDELYCPYHATKTHSLHECKKFGELSFKERKRVFCSKICYVSTARGLTDILSRNVTKLPQNVIFAEKGI